MIDSDQCVTSYLGGQVTLHVFWAIDTQPLWAKGLIVAAAVSEPEVNEQGSSLISRRLHYRGLQSLFLTKRKELWF